jgi:hypothetical protein
VIRLQWGKEPIVKKQNDNRYNSRFLLILLAAVGIVFIAAYFVLIRTSPLVEFLKPRETKENILSMAESFYRKLPVAQLEGEPQVFMSLDPDLLEYVQYYRKENKRFPDLSPGYWSIVWGTPPRGEKSKGARFFEVKYDFNGNLIGFTDNTGNTGKSDALPDSNEDDALFEARYFLGEYGIPVRTLTVVSKEISKKGNRTLYKFLLENSEEKYPDLLDQYTVQLLGGRVTEYQLDRVTAKKKLTGPGYAGDNALSAALMAITWLVIILTLIVRFVKKLRKDELEFNRGLWFGIILGGIVFINIAIGSHHDGSLINLLLGGGLSGAAAFLGLLLLYSTSESQGRAVWPEKLAVSDLLFQGRLSIRECGAAILRSFFFAGATLLVLGLTVFAVTSLNIGHVSFELVVMEGFQSVFSGISLILSTIVFAVFVGFTLIFFWPGFLREKVPGRFLFMLFLAMTFSVGGMQFVFFNPLYLALILLFPVALGWAYLVYRYDLFTLFLSFLGVKFFLNLALVSIIPGSLSSVVGLSVVIFVFVILLVGVYLVFRPHSAEDFDSYVPEYVNRIAERERMVRELEIARSVQMRFLPQSVPEFPNLDIVSLCQPAMEVGGDYYDFVRMDDRSMSVLIGDVSGKGVSAAFYMTMVKGIIKTLSRKTRQPSLLLAEVNEIFCENAPRDVFVTVIYGVFDLEKRSLTVASAGHNPLMVWNNKDGTVQLVNPKGIAIGLAAGERYRTRIEEATIPFNEGDVFIFYTDGVSESMNMNQEIFGEERLQEVLKASAHQSPRIIQRNVLEAVGRFSGKAPQHDDFTMIVVKIRL